MKILKVIGMAIAAGMLSINFTACSNEEETITTPEQEKYVTVNLGVTGEFIELKDSPLETRAGGTDLYGIQVYTITGNGMDTPYAYGTFSSLDDVSIKLLEGSTYKFVASIICDCELTMGMPGYDGTYSNDFMSSIHSEFQYNTIFNNSIGHVSNYEKIRFYGELAPYTPTKDGTVTIDTKRTVYGAHYIAEGLTEGNLEIKVITQPTHHLYSVNLTPATSEYDGIYSFSGQWSAWRGLSVKDEITFQETFVNYYTTKQLTISWTKDDGSVTPLGTYDVTFKRNIKTTIRIKVEDTGLQNGIVITREDATMTDDENEYVIEGGKVTEVPVTAAP